MGKEKEKEYLLWYIEKVKELLEEMEEEKEKSLENVVLDIEDLDLPFY